jgi:preprotein translocase subunit SecE
VEDKQEKRAKPSKEGKTLAQSAKLWFTDLRIEFRKIIWPSRKELVKQTTTVIVASLVVGGIVALMNFIYSNGLNLLSILLPRSGG